MTKNPYKEDKFQAFLKILSEGNFGHWYEIAQALGVDRDTITAWRRTEQGRAAIGKGIDYALTQMEKAGKKDWRMWHEKLKLLGLNAPQKLEHSAGDDPVATLLEKFGVPKEDKNDRQDDGAVQSPPQSS